MGTPVVTFLAGTTTAVAASGYQRVYGASCPAGTVLVGGAMLSTGVNIVASDHNASGTQWAEYVKNNGASALNATVSSTCLDVN